MLFIFNITPVSWIFYLFQIWYEIRKKVPDYFYKFTCQMKLNQVFPDIFSGNFLFCFFDKNLLSFCACEKIFFGSILLSRNSA